MLTRGLGAGIAVAATVTSAACGAVPNNVAANGNNVTNTQLPINQRFHTLDEYLAFLERTQGAIDKPWYRELRPGLYELVGGNFRPLGRDAPKHLFTRAELMKRFGFSR